MSYTLLLAHFASLLAHFTLFLSTFEYKPGGLYLQEFILVFFLVRILLYMLAPLSTPASTLCFLEHSFTHPIEQQLQSSACPSPIWCLGHSTGCSCPSPDSIPSSPLPLGVCFLTAPLRPGGAELHIPLLLFQAFGRKFLATFTWVSSVLQAKKKREEKGRKTGEKKSTFFSSGKAIGDTLGAGSPWLPHSSLPALGTPPPLHLSPKCCGTWRGRAAFHRRVAASQAYAFQYRVVLHQDFQFPKKFSLIFDNFQSFQ